MTSVPTRAVIGRSPWPDHFAIIGFAAAGGGGSMQAWPAGHYRLDVVIEPGHLTRTVEIVIDAAAAIALAVDRERRTGVLSSP